MTDTADHPPADDPTRAERRLERRATWREIGVEVGRTLAQGLLKLITSAGFRRGRNPRNDR